jgi:hypothetical protein
MEKLIGNQSKRSARLPERQKLEMKSIWMSGDHLPFRRLAVRNIILRTPMIIRGTRDFTFNGSKAKLFRLTYFVKRGFTLRNFIPTVGENI